MFSRAPSVSSWAHTSLARSFTYAFQKVAFSILTRTLSSLSKYVCRRRGTERFCYSSTLVYISSGFVPDGCNKVHVTSRLISCVSCCLFALFFFFLVVFFVFGLSNTHNPFIAWSFRVSKIPLRPGFALAINSNSIRKNDNIVV